MKPLYERQEGESKQAFEGFTIYRNLGLTRKLKDVGKKLGKNHSLIKRWSSQHNWVERAEAFDEEMDKRAILENAQLRKQMIKEHAEVSRKLLLKVKAAVEHIRPETLSPYEIAKLLEIAVKVERLSRGQSTDISEISHSGEITDKVDEQDIFKRVDQYAELYKQIADQGTA
ncbi:phage terminase small subunit-related protein [Bacillaceae bacterium CLA-AA-H227]|uniref:Phage terminase small subunit-related protein n=1 Tax=Robertmurraya yapensis (ex Hitch et al 2024) TaxID=3133160 RepID=A0ACC6SI07_9BACI|nr:phage terminase small subunit-related protein [Bacillus sp. CECT 9360]CAH0347701.1 hypothetical protein BCI9360_04124 [Bacillus sp. CECT 9360]